MAELLNIRRPDQTIIDALLTLLEQAEAGDVLAFAAVADLTDGRVASVYAGDTHVAKTIGALEILKARIMEGT